MNILITTLIIIIYILLMLFIFSLASLIPYSKKNIIFAFITSFILGCVGGAFLLLPIYTDIPSLVRGYYQYTIHATETITVEIPTGVDIGSIVSKIKSTPGVHNISTTGIIMHTDPFSQQRKQFIESKLKYLDPHIKDWQVYSNGKIIIKTEGGDPNNITKKISDWLIYTGGIYTKSSRVNACITVDASKVDNVLDMLSAENVIVTGIHGPVEEKVKNVKSMMPPKSQIVLFSGILGILVAIAGIFSDAIIRTVRRIKVK